MAIIIKEKQDLTHLKWTHARTSSGTAGTFLKSEAIENRKKIYYKLSTYDSEKGIVGHECINEIIVDRLLGVLGVEHLGYQLIYADIRLDGMQTETWLCASQDFKDRGETKAALDNYYQINRIGHESHYEFCKNQGWQQYIDTMLAVDYLIMNQDRHGANIEVLRNSRKRSIRIAPLFDHGLSLLCSCYGEQEIHNFDTSIDRPCHNFIGSRSTLDNLNLIEHIDQIFSGRLSENAEKILFEDLEGVLSREHMDKIWKMIWDRWCHYEDLCNSR